MNIKKLAEAIDTALLNKVAIGDISNYAIDIVPDNNKIEIVMMKRVPIKNLKIDLKIMREKK